MAPRCEVCGRQILGVAKSVEIDGGIFTVCPSCAKLGSPVAQKPKPPTPKPQPLRLPVREELELRPDYNIVIKQAREKLGLTQDALGRRIGEKPSVIKLLESGKLRPDNVLAKKIEHSLRVRLLQPAELEM